MMKRLLIWSLFSFPLLSLLHGFTQIPPRPFGHISIDEGLSHTIVNDILQDDQGFLWIATGNGLNRFDGYSFDVFKHSHKTENSVSHNNIYDIHQDSEGLIWIGTLEGIDVYDPRIERFIHFKDQLLNDSTGYLARAIHEDHQGDIWLATGAGYFIRYDKATQHVRRFKTDDYIGTDHQTAGAFRFYSDEQKRLWVATALTGLFLYDPANERFENFIYDTLDTGERNSIRDIVQVTDNKMLIAGDGLYEFDVTARKYKKLRHKQNPVATRILPLTDSTFLLPDAQKRKIYHFDYPNDSLSVWADLTAQPGSTSNTGFTSIYKDRNDVIWLGLLKDGLLKYDRHRKDFRNLTSTSGPHALSSSGIGAIFEDSHGNLWVTTQDGNLNLCDPILDSVIHYSDYGNPGNFKGGLYGSIIETDDGNVWVSTWTWDLRYFNPASLSRSPESAVFPALLKDENTMSGWAPRKLLADENGDIWIAYYDHGLDRFDPEARSFTNYSNSPECDNCLSSNHLWTVFKSSAGLLYLGTEMTGFDVFDPVSGVFKNYRKDDDAEILRSNSVRCFHEDPQHRIWIGTGGGGLTLFDPASGEFRTWDHTDGLPDDVVYGILEDNHGRLWLSTENGISCFTPPLSAGDDGQFRNYCKEDGIQGNEFNINSYFENEGGWMFFGGSKGLTYFHPDSIRDNPISAEVRFSRLKLFNETVSPGEVINGQSVLTEALPYTDHITLDYRNSDFTIEFTSTHYSVPEKNIFYYKLEGFDRDWKKAPADRRFATYTNLNPGTYELKVKAANNDGLIKANAATLTIEILPPWWLTSWAISSYCVAILVALYTSATLIRRRERQRHVARLERMELEKQAELAIKEHEIDKMKIGFFMKISHEFRTPLTLILGPIDNLMKRAQSSEDKNYCQLIHRNTRRLLKLINQLLDLNKLESGNMNVQYDFVDVVKLSQEIFDSFGYLARRSAMRFTFESDTHSLQAFIDVDKFEKITYNLLSNAFKFTHDAGEIRFSLKTQDPGHVVFAVEDSGVGIPEDDLPFVFDRFYQGSNRPLRKQNGTGIGLSLVKELVEKMRGRIAVANRKEGGILFTITLPCVREHATPSSHENVNRSGTYPHISMHTIDEAIQNPGADSWNENDVYILIVDDNPDIRMFLRKELDDEYKIIEAENGEAAFQLAVDFAPDIVLSDIMMPVMDGYSLCRKIKSDERTCHIPVVLLTARCGEANQLEGLEFGADDYVEKPFNMEILKRKMANRIASRRKLIGRFSAKYTEHWFQSTSCKLDQEFLRKTINIVREQMSDQDFDVTRLTRLSGYGRTNFYKKIKALTGMSVNDFIRTIRLHEAEKLLRDPGNPMNVNEVAYHVGFKDPSYFTKCFKAEFGVLPTRVALGQPG